MAKTALVSGDEILVGRHAAGQPAVSSGILEIPSLLRVDESDAETFCRAVFLNHRAEPLHALAGCLDVGQYGVVGAALR